MFGFLHLALIFAFVAYYIQSNCPLDSECPKDAGLTCDLIHQYIKPHTPYVTEFYTANVKQYVDSVAVKLPSADDIVYFKELKALSNDFLGIRDDVKKESTPEDDTFATTPSATPEVEAHVAEEKVTPEDLEEKDTTLTPEEFEVVPETGAVETPIESEEQEEVILVDEHIPSERQEVIEVAEEYIEEALAAEAIEVAQEIGENL